MEFVNKSSDTYELPTLGDDPAVPLRVGPGETFTATGEAAKGLLDHPAFERADKPSKTSEKE